MIKLTVCTARHPDMSHEEYLDYWRNRHGPLVASVPEFSRYIRKYVQCHPIPGTDTLFGSPCDYDGVAELWFDSVDDMMKAFSDPKYLEIVRPDELKFADFSRCMSIVSEENIVIDT